MNQEMAILGWEELRLTAEESAGIARLSRRWSLPRTALHRLHERAAGWVAGLLLMLERAQMGGQTAHEAGDVAAHALFDYFAGEIFERTDPRTRDLLLRTAFLSSMTVQAATTLTGMATAGHLLSELCRKHYFTELRGDGEPVYQYHPLFREFLLSRARATFTGAGLARLQRPAAAVMEAVGRVEDAVTLLREAADWQDLARVVGAQAPALLRQGRERTLESWLASLPRPVLERTPWLLYWLGACRLPFDLVEGRRYFERAFDLFKAEGDAAGLFLAWSGVVDSLLYEWGDFTRLDRWIATLDDLRRDLPDFPSAEIELRVASGVFSALMYRQPQHPDIASWEERLKRLMQSSADVNCQVMVGIDLVPYYLWVGDLAKAQLIIDALRLAARAPGVTPAVQQTWWVVDAWCAWMTGAHEACLKVVAEGLETARSTGVHLRDFLIFAQGVYGSLTSGDLEAGADFLRSMSAVMDGSHILDVCHYHYLAAWHGLLRGDLPEALEHADAALTLAVKAGTPFPEAICHVGLAKVLFERGAHEEAAAHLARARHIGHSMQSALLEYDCLLTEAQFALDRGDGVQGQDFLRQALTLGRQRGYVNLFWWRPSVMARLCARALEAGIEVEYVRHLIRTRALEPPAAAAGLDAWPRALRIVTLGRFEVRVNDRPIAVVAKAQRRPLDLLKALIAFGGREVSEGRLIEALWPDSEGDAAARTLDTNVHRLRKLLGVEKVLMLEHGQFSLDPACCRVDTWALERVLEEVEAALKEGRTDAAADDITRWTDRILSLYRGPFLGEGADEPWAFALRERLRGKCVRQLVRLGRYWEQVGQWEKATEGYRRSLEADDLAEELYQRLMICYRHLSRRADGLAVYARCRETLRVRLGAPPSPETEAIRDTLRAGR